MPNLCRTWITFPLQEAMYNYNKTKVSRYDPTKLANYSILRPQDDFISNCGQNFEKCFPSTTLGTSLTSRTSWLLWILFIVILSTFKFQEKSNRSTDNGITFPDLVKNSSASPATINITVLLISSLPVISFWTRTIYGTWFQQLLCR